MSAGHDTSANVLSWGLYIMATRQDIQSKLQDEIGDLVAETPDPTYTEVERLRYLDHFVKEILRVFSPGSLFPCQRVTTIRPNDVIHSSYNLTSPSHRGFDH